MKYSVTQLLINLFVAYCDWFRQTVVVFEMERVSGGCASTTTTYETNLVQSIGRFWSSAPATTTTIVSHHREWQCE